MSYKTVEDGVAVIIKKISGYDDNNVSQGDNRILGRGKIKAVVLQRGLTNPREQLTMGSSPAMMNRWVVNAELLIPFTTSAQEVPTTVRDETQKIVDEIDKWPKLAGVSGVLDSTILFIPEPEAWDLGDGPGRWWRQIIPISIEEVTEAVRSE